MRFAFFCVITSIVLFGLLGCGSTPPESTENLVPHYAAVPSSEMVLSRPTVTVANEPELNGFLGELAGAIMRRDWRDIAYALSPAEYAEQFAFMKRDNPERSDADVAAQILEETLGFGMAENNLGNGEPRDASQPFARFDRIRHVEINAIDLPGSEYRQVDGLVSLEDGSTLSLSFSVVQNSSGEWRIAVPMG